MRGLGCHGPVVRGCPGKKHSKRNTKQGTYIPRRFSPGIRSVGAGLHLAASSPMPTSGLHPFPWPPKQTPRSVLYKNVFIEMAWQPASSSLVPTFSR